MMESLVADLLRQSGFVILEQNYKVGHLEIDLIAMEKQTLCFIEVKARGIPIRLEEIESIIPPKKRENITIVADCYCRNLRKLTYQQVRFDYALVYMPHHAAPKVQYIRDAFTPTLTEHQ